MLGSVAELASVIGSFKRSVPLFLPLGAVDVCRVFGVRLPGAHRFKKYSTVRTYVRGYAAFFRYLDTVALEMPS